MMIPRDAAEGWSKKAKPGWQGKGLEASARYQWTRVRVLGEQVGRGGEQTEHCSADLH